MNSLNFCYWLQGLFELSPSHKLNAKQTAIIKEHLALALETPEPLASPALAFCNYLTGAFAMWPWEELNKKDADIIKKQLQLVFTKVTGSDALHGYDGVGQYVEATPYQC